MRLHGHPHCHTHCTLIFVRFIAPPYYIMLHSGTMYRKLAEGLTAWALPHSAFLCMVKLVQIVGRWPLGDVSHLMAPVWVLAIATAIGLTTTAFFQYAEWPQMRGGAFIDMGVRIVGRAFWGNICISVYARPPRRVNGLPIAPLGVGVAVMVVTCVCFEYCLRRMNMQHHPASYRDIGYQLSYQHSEPIDAPAASKVWEPVRNDAWAVWLTGGAVGGIVGGIVECGIPYWCAMLRRMGGYRGMWASLPSWNMGYRGFTIHNKNSPPLRAARLCGAAVGVMVGAMVGVMVAVLVLGLSLWLKGPDGYWDLSGWLMWLVVTPLSILGGAVWGRSSFFVDVGAVVSQLAGIVLVFVFIWASIIFAKYVSLLHLWRTRVFNLVQMMGTPYG